MPKISGPQTIDSSSDLGWKEAFPFSWVDILTVTMTYWYSFLLILVFRVWVAQGACDLGSEMPEKQKTNKQTKTCHHLSLKGLGIISRKVGSFPSPHATVEILPRDSQTVLLSSIL